MIKLLKVKQLDLLLLLCFVAISISAQTINKEIDGIKYILDASNKTATVTYKTYWDYRSSANMDYTGDVTVPEKVTNDGVEYVVNAINTSAFRGCGTLKSVSLPSSISIIGSAAFWGCDNLMSFSIPILVTAIDHNTFYQCTALKSVSFPNGLTTIGSDAFNGCLSLQNVSFPSSVTKIGSHAFEGCSSLSSITFPKSVEIDQYAFQHCTSLAKLTVPAKTIGFCAFNGCTGLNSLTLTNEVEKIDGAAFGHCSALTSLFIPASVKQIASGSFEYCSSLESISVATANTMYNSPNNCNAIMENDNLLLVGCKKTVIPSNTISIASHAFSGCADWAIGADLVLPSTLKSIGSYAFSGCSGLKSISVPSTATAIGEYAFEGCSNMDNIKLPPSLAYKEIRNGMFSGCSSLLSITIPSNVTSIGKSAFYGCSSLKSIELPSVVTSIGDYAFYGCSSLESFSIPSGVKSLNSSTFSNCSSLKSIFIPASVKEIGDRVFSGCNDLKSVVVASDNPVYDSRDNCNAIIVTATNALLYGCQSTIIPQSIVRINYEAFLDIQTLTSIFIPKGVTFIYEPFKGCSGLESIVVEEGNPTFDSRNDCNAILNTQLNSLIVGCKNTVIPTSVTTIGSNAFNGCSQLESIDIPASVTSIENDAFAGCMSLKNVSLPSSLTQLGSWVFSNCSALESITFPALLTAIEDYVLMGCESLKEVHSLIMDPSVIKNPNIFCNDEVYQAATLYVPVGTLEVYQATTGWKDFFNIQEETASTIEDVRMEYGNHPSEDLVERYDLRGHRLSSPVRGINIIRFADGSTRKISVR